MISTSTGHGRDLLFFAKIYTDDVKYSSRNDSFKPKLEIFHDVCSSADVSPKAKIKAFSTIFKAPALDNDLIRRESINWDKTQNDMDETRVSIG